MAGKPLAVMAITFLFLNFLMFLPGFLFSGEGGAWLPAFQPSEHLANLGPILSLLLRRDTLDPWRISADLVLIFSFFLLPGRMQFLQKRYNFLTILFVFLLVYEIYVAVVFYFMGKQALLAEDWQYLSSVWNFLRSLEFFQLLIYLLTFLLAFTALLLCVRAVFHRLSRQRWGFPWSVRTSQSLLITFVLYLLVCFYWYGIENRRLVVQMSSLKILANLQRSWSYLNHRDQINDLHLPSYLPHPPLVEAPNIYLFLIESYGQILVEHPHLQAEMLPFLAETEKILKAKNFHMRTALSQSPVFGGRSWLSQASIFSANMVRQQWQFESLVKRGLQQQNLARFLQDAGYHTVGLYPGNRRKVDAVGSQNVYGKDIVFSFDELDYTGPAYNWGQVPDQYSLNFVWENYLQQLNGPYFFSFLTISSHAPWDPMPHFIANWRDLNQDHRHGLSPKAFLFRQIIDRIAMSWLSASEDHQAYDKFQQAIIYEWQVFADFLSKHAQDNDVFILVGDHQPYIAQWSNSKESTLIHVLSKNERVLDAFTTNLMKPGLIPKQETVMQHADIHELIIDGILSLNGQQQNFSRRPIKP
ncbi:MAG: sulfatase-like hydrolase/transferase [Oligoflexus sp.]